MVAAKAGVVKLAPSVIKSVSAASLYQLKEAFAILLLAVKVTAEPEHTEASAAVISAAVAFRSTVTVTVLASAARFSQRVAELTVT
ncbi:hypothetical protein D3C80_1288430 [compost metagenome]